MFPKILVAIILAAGIGVGLLSLRQQRLEIMNEITAEHRKVDRTRKEIWDIQVRIAERTKPQEVQRVTSNAKLVLEPIAQPQDQRTAQAEPPQPISP
ncbi:hypothetical protein KS4_11690 [Poriferisphaera corsica]|uniref:Uncharacterized protein n=1 Tax=Poriferisphaera corsica TaxID=2528020 RepID=A0A517YSC1_9BACT|nr:hypothetical protein [Poriferisphaera corsica]QDU33127.1 hypothetical protein KS4_11690 [Poriferisphaera corsica]